MAAQAPQSEAPIAETTGAAASVSPVAGFSLGDWWVEPGLGVVSRPNETRHLPPQQMDLLAYLAARPGQLVPKEELLNAVWKGAVVEEIALPRCVSEIRKVLGDDAKAPRYIETVPKRGYRLLTSTVRPAQETPTQTPNPTPNFRRRPRLPARWALVVTLLFAAALLAWAWRGVRAVSLRAARPELPAVTSQRSLAILGFTDRSRDEGMVWLETALPDLLASELALAPEVRVIPPELVAPLLAELTPVGASSPSRVFLERAGKTLGADLLAWGAYSMVAGEAGGDIRIELTVQAAGEQKPLLVLSQDGPSLQPSSLPPCWVLACASGWGQALPRISITKPHRRCPCGAPWPSGCTTRACAGCAVSKRRRRSSCSSVR